MTQTILTICTTCRGIGDADPDAPRPGAELLAALEKSELPPDITLRPAECLSACKNGCAIALSAPNRWTYVYGLLDPKTHVEQIVQGAIAYSNTPDGLVPWRERPEIFRKQSIARIPPQEKS